MAEPAKTPERIESEHIIVWLHIRTKNDYLIHVSIQLKLHICMHAYTIIWLVCICVCLPLSRHHTKSYRVVNNEFDDSCALEEVISGLYSAYSTCMRREIRKFLKKMNLYSWQRTAASIICPLFCQGNRA